jgi:sugar diacid utilization regulator
MVTTDRTVYVLLPAGDPAAAVRFADGARKAFDRVFPDEVRIGISASSTDVARLPVLRSEVDDIVRVLTTRTGCVSVASIEAVRLEVLLGHLADTFDHDPVLRHSGVDAMIAYDLEHSTHYSASVLAWVEALGDVAAAATVLDVHANTLRYRLRRVEELFSIMITDSDERLAAWLQLRADGSAVAVRGDRMQGSLAAVHVSGSPSEVAAAT